MNGFKLTAFQYTYAYRSHISFGHGGRVIPALWFRYIPSFRGRYLLQTLILNIPSLPGSKEWKGDITDANGTPFVYEIFRIGYCIRGKCTLYIGQIFLIQMKWPPAKHVSYGTVSVISPFYYLLPAPSSYVSKFSKWSPKFKFFVLYFDRIIF